jgi:hypothetical protein
MSLLQKGDNAGCGSFATDSLTMQHAVFQGIAR